MCDIEGYNRIKNGKYKKEDKDFDKHFFKFSVFFPDSLNQNQLLERFQLIADKKSISIPDDENQLKSYIETKYKIKITMKSNYSGTRRFFYKKILLKEDYSKEEFKKALDLYKQIIEYDDSNNTTVAN